MKRRFRIQCGRFSKRSASPRIKRKDLAEKLIAPEADANQAKMKLASDLHWLVREGHIVEFNDGALDLPRTKAPNLQVAEKSQAHEETSLPASEISVSASAREDARPPERARFSRWGRRD